MLKEAMSKTKAGIYICFRTTKILFTLQHTRITHKQNTLSFLVTRDLAWPISNCFPPRAAGDNFWFFIAVLFGGGSWYKAKCELRDAVTQNRWQKERTKLWIFRKIANWRRWRQAPRLTAMAVVTDSHRHFLMIWQVADVKISPTMTRQPKWSIKIPQSMFVCVSKFATNAPAAALWLTEIAQMARCQRQTHRRRWPGNPNRSKFRNLHLLH